MKPSILATVLGCVLTFVVTTPAYAQTTIPPDWEKIKEVKKFEIESGPAEGMVFRAFDSNKIDPPDGRLGRAVVQLTYEPGGVRKLFSLVGIKVAQGPVTVGFQKEDGTIGVYNPLSAEPWMWSLGDSDRIDRLTLECPDGKTPTGELCLTTTELFKAIAVEFLEVETQLPNDDAASVRFVALGDTGMIDSANRNDRDPTKREDPPNRQQDVANALEKWCNLRGCNFALLLGDNFYNGGIESCTNTTPDTSKSNTRFNTTFETPYKQSPRPWTEPLPSALRMPFYVALGNHDYGNNGGAPFVWNRPGSQVQYASSDGVNSNNPACKEKTKETWSGNWRMGAKDGRPEDEQRYYAFERGNVQFLALDTTPIVAESWRDGRGRLNGTNDYVNRQEEFITTKLDKQEPLWKIAFGHHPYRSNGSHGNAGSYDIPNCPSTADETNGWACGVRLKDFVEKKMCNKGLDLYLSGHDHNLQWHSAACGPSGRKVEFIVSGAGATVTDLKAHGAETRKQEKKLGFVYVVIKGNKMDVSMIDIDNIWAPLFSARCTKNEDCEKFEF